MALAHEAVDATAASDDLIARSTLLSQCAEVLLAADDVAAAVEALSRAAALHAEKGNQLQERQCRTRLAEAVARCDASR